MIKVFTSPDPVRTSFVKSLLDEHGIASVSRNEFVFMGGVDLPFTETWPEVWILNDDDHQAAHMLIARLDKEQTIDRQPDWICPGCGETIEGQFNSCWNCSVERPEIGF